MATRFYFSCLANRWYIRIDPETVRRVRDLAGIDLETVTLRPLVDIIIDPMKLTDFLSVVIQPRAPGKVFKPVEDSLRAGVLAFASAMEAKYPRCSGFRKCLADAAKPVWPAPDQLTSDDATKV